MPDNRKPLIYGAFPVCRNYTVRAQLCQLAAGQRRAHEADPGVAGSQRLYHHGEHLRPLGLQVQDHFGKCNGQYPDSAGHKADRLGTPEFLPKIMYADVTLREKKSPVIWAQSLDMTGFLAES